MKNRLRAKNNGYLTYFTGVKKFLFQKIGTKTIQSGLKKTLHAQGYGRLTLEELVDVAKKDLTALSTFLGDKCYIFGDKPSTVDATLFGHLCQFLYTPLITDQIKHFIEQSTPNLVTFANRVKAEYWPDWEITCLNLALNPIDIK